MLVDCPGCEKCRDTDGYILRWNAGRPTSAHEHIFLLTKSPRYFYDADAVREPHEDKNVVNGVYQNDKAVNKAEWMPREKDGIARESFRMNNREYNPAGRNQRNVWTLSPEPFTGWGQTSRQVRVEPDAADDDTMRTPSADCPVHAWTGRSDPIRVGDERGGGGSIRTAGSDDRPALERPSGSAPTDPIHGAATEGESWDSLPLLCSPAATPRSNGTSRTDPALATNPPCTPSAQTSGRIDGTSASPAVSGSADRTPESNTEPVDSADHPSVRTVSRTADRPSCTCSYHKTVTESISHFATFPTEIPRRCIKAGTSEKGCCAACGAPWVRIVEKPQPPDELRNRGNGSKMDFHSRQTGGGQKIQDWYDANPAQTTGWTPTCVCGDTSDVVPCLVLDPFGGSGTTGLVADELGRDCILVELNPEYAQMAEQRIRGAAPMFANVEVIRASLTRCPLHHTVIGPEGYCVPCKYDVPPDDGAAPMFAAVEAT